MASASKSKKIARVYVGVSVVAFSGWVLFVSCKLVILAGHFVSSAVSTVLHSVPFIG
jgi:hypothetical protein